MRKFIRTPGQLRVAKYMLSGEGDATVNPHYTATEANVSDAVVRGFFRRLRQTHALVTVQHESGGRCVDPDTRALYLTPGPEWPSFVAEAQELGLKVDPYYVCPGAAADKCASDGWGLMLLNG